MNPKLQKIAPNRWPRQVIETRMLANEACQNSRRRDVEGITFYGRCLWHGGGDLMILKRQRWRHVPGLVVIVALPPLTTVILTLGEKRGG